MLSLFRRPWSEVPICFIDTETTGTRPGIDRAVQVALVRFEGGKETGAFGTLVYPGIPIPAEATTIHGITDADVQGMPSISEVFERFEVKALLAGAQPGAYNAGFDCRFVPPFLEEWSWPWLDPLTFIRVIDKYAKGHGRHKLQAACDRHGVTLEGAHGALADARAAGQLFYALAPTKHGPRVMLGDVLRWQREQEAAEWYRFTEWLSRQPPKAAATEAPNGTAG